MQVIWSFDTEDYVTPEADDALLRWAELLAARGIRGTFCLVAEKARKLRERGRDDVLAALAHHDIGYHSNLHSRHPTFPEYLEHLGWDDGIDAVLAREDEGMSTVAAITGQGPVCDVPPGKAWAPQVIAAMRRRGISISAGAYVCEADRSPTSYCGALTVRYGIAMENFIREDDPLRAAQDAFRRMADQAHPRHGVLIPFSHPCMAVTESFWDGVNFAGGKNPPPAALCPAPLRSPAETGKFFAFVESFVDWLATQKNFETITYPELLARYPLARSRELTLDTTLRMAEVARRRVGPVVTEDGTYTAAEVLSCLVRTFLGAGEAGKLPVRVSFGSPLGPRFAANDPTPADTIEISELLRQLRFFDRVAGDDEPMPHECKLCAMALAPGDLLATLAEGVIRWAAEGWLPERLAVVKGRAYPDLPEMEAAWRPFQFQGTWPIFPPDFEGRQVAELGRRMLWSYRPLR